MKQSKKPALLLLFGLLVAGLLWWFAQRPSQGPAAPPLESAAGSAAEKPKSPESADLKADPPQASVRKDLNPPTALPLPEANPSGETLQARSRFWQTPLAFARIARMSPERAQWVCDEAGRFPAIPITQGMTMAVSPGLEPAEFFPSEAPSVKPNRTIHLGKMATLRFQAPEGLSPNQIHKAHAAAWCDSGEVWPLVILGVETHGTEWLVRMEEQEEFTLLDPATKVLLRLADPKRSLLWIEGWTPKELYLGTVKELRSVPTGKLEVDVSRRPFAKDSSMDKQEVQDLRLVHGNQKIAGMDHPPVLGWLACPHPSLWRGPRDKQRTLTQIPAGPWRVLAELSGTTQVENLTLISAGETASLDLFQLARANSPTGSAPSERGTPSRMRDFAEHTSIIWDSRGQLVYREVWDSVNGIPVDGAELIPQAPSNSYCWWLLSDNDDQDSYHAFGTENMPMNKAIAQRHHPAGPEPGTNMGRFLQSTPSPRIQLVDEPSTAWQGKVTLHFISWDYKRGGFRIRYESQAVSWPEQKGRKLKSLSKRHRYRFWYATSPTGRGTFGSLGTSRKAKGSKSIQIDPSMTEGWSALAKTQAESPEDPRMASVAQNKTPPKSKKPFMAAGGLELKTSSMVYVEQMARQFGFSLISSAACPPRMTLEIPGVLKKRITPDPETVLFEIRLRKD